MSVSVKIDWDVAAIRKLIDAAKTAAVETIDTLHGEVVSEQVMPFDTGNMQNGGTYTSGFSIKGNQTVSLDDGDGNIHVALTNDAPQARRLYYHPEYNFQTVNNPNAGGEWLQPWIDGEKKDFVKDTFAENYKKEAGL